jgi:hypothetical protein
MSRCLAPSDLVSIRRTFAGDAPVGTVDVVVWDACPVGRRTDREPLSVDKSDDHARRLEVHGSPARVASLLEVSRPPHVARLIIPVVVREPVNGVIGRWARADVGKEAGKPIVPGPAVTDRDASPSVTMPMRSSRVGAPHLHGEPDVVLGRPSDTPLPAARASVLRVDPLGVLSLETAARDGCAVAQVLERDDRARSAVARRVEHSRPLRRRRLAGHRPSTEPVANGKLDAPALDNSTTSSIHADMMWSIPPASTVNVSPVLLTSTEAEAA